MTPADPQQTAPTLAMQVFLPLTHLTSTLSPATGILESTNALQSMPRQHKCLILSLVAIYSMKTNELVFLRTVIYQECPSRTETSFKPTSYFFLVCSSEFFILRDHPELQVPFTGVQKNEVVSGIDLEIHRNEIFGFLSHNGTGKTISLSMIMGVLNPSAESIIVSNHLLPGSEGVKRRAVLSDQRQHYHTSQGYSGQNANIQTEGHFYKSEEIPNRIMEDLLEYIQDKKAAFPGQITHLDQEIAANRFGVKSVGLSLTTLEEVFCKPARTRGS
ncbi:hypothetical protein BGX27_001564 [Mortierella sp. AM989]|nr:hypothetical protein BGX27_001564 [Mortierella sp. AM989]